MIQTIDRQILYVDDTEEQRYAMRRILEGAGFKVLEAGTGAEALRKLHPEILAVVLDVKLPDMNGYDVCRRIKGNSATASIPVLQISASFADPELRSQGLSGGADAYVAQPVHPVELLALVNALIRSYDSEKTLRFQAKASARLTASIDYDVTLAAAETVFVPDFADRCFVCLNPQRRLTPDPAPKDLPRSEASQQPPISDLLRELAIEVYTTGQSRLRDASAILVPLEIGRRRIGTLVFQLDGQRRRYTPADIVLAEDLADRAALALQNSSLYRAQQVAQTALVQSEKLAAAGRLTAAIAHEINNPLEAITNLIYLIETSPETPATIRGFASEALSELARLTHIARQSLGFYRELTGPVLFDLNEGVDQTLALYRKRFSAKKIKIERHYTDGLQLTAVKGEIRQVISNLLVNALDALPDGGRLNLTTANGGDGMVVLQIADNGCGIPSEVMPKIFEPFFTTKDGTGTGLGLWVSDNIIRKHGGTLTVTSNSSETSHGTSFVVTLPRNLIRAI